MGRVNANRERLGVSPTPDVLRHIVTDDSWLAADAALAPAASVPRMTIAQTGAWILADASPLPPEVEAISRSWRATRLLRLREHTGYQERPVPLSEAARVRGWRAIVSRR